MAETVLIAGGTGLVGSRLSFLLKEKGYNVIHLSRTANPTATYPAYAWDLNKMSIDQTAVEQADYIISLAGAGIADKPWTQQRKQLIIDSRVNSNVLLWDTIKKLDKPPKAFVAASAIGYYGDSGESIVNERTTYGSGFLTESTIQWEAAIQDNQLDSVRTVLLRIGVVLSTKGGALPKMMMPFKFLTATYFGDGRQWYSWIHIDDLAHLFINAIEKESMKGVYNAVAPQPIRNKAFTETIGKVLKKKSILMPAPSFALRLGLGEMADAVLFSTRVSADKTLESGFKFQYPELESALQDIITNNK
ncbi:MAG: TIGR01777 family oxidoreductase [Bacteroidota bacterium]